MVWKVQRANMREVACSFLVLALFLSQESSQRYNVRVDLFLGHWCSLPIRRHNRSGSLKNQGKGYKTTMAPLHVNVTVMSSGDSRRGKRMMKT